MPGDPKKEVCLKGKPGRRTVPGVRAPCAVSNPLLKQRTPPREVSSMRLGQSDKRAARPSTSFRFSVGHPTNSARCCEKDGGEGTAGRVQPRALAPSYSSYEP